MLRDFSKNCVRAHSRVHDFYAKLHAQMGTQRALLEASTAETGQLSPDKIEELSAQIPKPTPSPNQKPSPPNKYTPALDGKRVSAGDVWQRKRKSAGPAKLDDWLPEQPAKMLTQPPAWAPKPSPPPTTAAVAAVAPPPAATAPAAAAAAISDEQRNRIEQNRLAAMQRRKAKLEERQTAVAAVIAAAEERDQVKRSRNEPEVSTSVVCGHCFDSIILSLLFFFFVGSSLPLHPLSQGCRTQHCTTRTNPLCLRTTNFRVCNPFDIFRVA